MTRASSLAAALALTLSACATSSGSRTPPPSLSVASFPFRVDTMRTFPVADGVRRHYLYSPAGPWAIHALDVDLARCNTAVAVKGAPGAEGRTKTSELLRDLAATRDVVGGVNADFFLFTPPGVPTGAMVIAGRVITPPSNRPVFAMDSAGVPHITTFRLRDFDSLAVGDPRLAQASLLPFHPLEAVGGRPVMTRDSVIVVIPDANGQPSFINTRHPRTAVGISNNGKRLLLVVVDGRQAGYSDGMSLPELATLMLALGARDAINLDGGGSTTLVYADSTRAMQIANRPSDPTGERPVGNALAIVRGACAEARR
jgi:hypothetical protein